MEIGNPGRVQIPNFKFQIPNSKFQIAIEVPGLYQLLLGTILVNSQGIAICPIKNPKHLSGYLEFGIWNLPEGLKGLFDGNLLEGLHNISLFDVIVVLDLHTAVISLGNLFHIVLESFQ